MAIIQYFRALKKGDDHLYRTINKKHRYELSDDHNFNIDDDDFEFLAETCAEDFYDNHDGWEVEWPCLFMIWIDDTYLGMFEAELDHTPVFTTKNVD
ncbi:MAG: hypothetical protein ACQEWL_04785 [Pseudomonadota bacterium]